MPPPPPSLYPEKPNPDSNLRLKGPLAPLQLNSSSVFPDLHPSRLG